MMETTNLMHGGNNECDRRSTRLSRIKFKHSLFDYVVVGPLYHDLMETRYFKRLEGVRQVDWNEYNKPSVRNTRALHCLTTGALAELVLMNNGFEPHYVNLGVAAGMMHDAPVPPFPDIAKHIFNTHEEDDIGLILAEPDVAHVLKKYNIDPDEVASCVRGDHPVLGKMINSKGSLDLDRIAYTCMDVTHLPEPQAIPMLRLYSNVDAFGMLDPHFLDVYDDLRINSDGSFYFTNLYRVAKVLETRALMYDIVYLNTDKIARESCLKEEFKKILASGRLPITKERLIRMTDCEFLEAMRAWSGTAYRMLTDEYSDAFLAMIIPVSKIGTDYAESYRNNRDFLIDEGFMFDPAIGTPVMENGKVIPFREAWPFIANKVNDIAVTNSYARVCHRPGPVQ